MSEYLVIRLATEDQAVQWVLTDSHGTRRSGVSSGDLEQAAAAVGEHAVIVLLPAQDVLLTSVHIPARSAAKIRAALPFALEENVADDVEDLHFAVGTRQENNRLPVAIVAHETMSKWLQRLHAVGIEPEIMVAENHGLAKIPGTMSILVDDGAVMYNDGADTEFCLQGVNPSDVLVVAGQLGEDAQQETEDAAHLVVFCTPEQQEKLSHDWIALRHELHSVDVNVLPDGVLPKLAVTVATGRGVNLLQGSYGKKTEYGPLLQPWKVAAVLLLGLAIIGLSMKGVAYYQLLQDEATLRAQFTAEYRRMHPGDSREIVDPVAIVDSMRRAAGTAATPQVFLPGLRQLGVALAANSGATIEAISYRAGVIDLRLTAPDVATLDNIQQAVTASGRFQASIESTNQVGDKTDGRIRIREAGT